MTDNLVLVEKTADWATVTLNRPDALNALSADMVRELARAFQQLAEDPSIAALILTGAGRAFCAGLDLGELRQQGLLGLMSNQEADVVELFTNFDRPIIGAINGVAATAGFELALMCDLLVATPEAKFIDSHARVGLVSGWGLSQRLQRIIGVNRAREYHFTGRALSADKAEAWGLVNHIVDSGQLIPTCEALAAEMASCDRAALAGLKRVINEGGAMTLGDSLPYEHQAMYDFAEQVSMETLQGNIERILSRGKGSRD